jgi:hypothetical protein
VELSEVATVHLDRGDLNLLITALAHQAKPESDQYEAVTDLASYLICERDRLQRIEARRLARVATQVEQGGNQ